MFYVNLIFQKPRTPFKYFFAAQFKYCPLTWMFCSRSTKKKINKPHVRALRIVYDDCDSMFDELMVNGQIWLIHNISPKHLGIENINI